MTSRQGLKEIECCAPEGATTCLNGQAVADRALIAGKLNQSLINPVAEPHRYLRQAQAVDLGILYDIKARVEGNRMLCA